jgi:hypothetical protein
LTDAVKGREVFLKDGDAGSLLASRNAVVFLCTTYPFLLFKVAKKRFTHIREAAELSAIPTFFFKF